MFLTVKLVVSMQRGNFEGWRPQEAEGGGQGGPEGEQIRRWKGLQDGSKQRQQYT